MDTAAILDHQFRVAAHVVAWTIQLGYLAWLGLRWRTLKRRAARRNNLLRSERFSAR